jgi:hypothetical protein
MTDFHPHDAVELDRDFGRWPAGTLGAVVDEFPGGVVVEIVGPAGETLDLLELSSDHLRAATDAPHAVGHGSSS